MKISNFKKYNNIRKNIRIFNKNRNSLEDKDHNLSKIPLVILNILKIYGTKKYNKKTKGKNNNKCKDNKGKRINSLKETNMVIILKAIYLQNWKKDNNTVQIKMIKLIKKMNKYMKQQTIISLELQTQDYICQN